MGEGVRSRSKGPALEIEQPDHGEVDAKAKEEDSASFGGHVPHTGLVVAAAAAEINRSGNLRFYVERPDRKFGFSIWVGEAVCSTRSPSLSRGHVGDAGTVKVKTALAQSPGSAATTRNSFVSPTTGSTFRLGPVVRHDVAGSFVENPVSWPTDVPASGDVPWGIKVSSTIWPFQSPK
jgi:hypothetical protein